MFTSGLVLSASPVVGTAAPSGRKTVHSLNIALHVRKYFSFAGGTRSEKKVIKVHRTAVETKQT